MNLRHHKRAVKGLACCTFSEPEELIAFVKTIWRASGSGAARIPFSLHYCCIATTYSNLCPGVCVTNEMSAQTQNILCPTRHADPPSGWTDKCASGSQKKREKAAMLLPALVCWFPSGEVISWDNDPTDTLIIITDDLTNRKWRENGAAA